MNRILRKYDTILFGTFLDEQADEESPLHPTILKQNGSAGVRFHDLQTNHSIDTSFPEMNHNSKMASEKSSDIHAESTKYTQSKSKSTPSKPNRRDIRVRKL